MAKTPAKNATQQMFSADVVAIVLMASGTVSLSGKQYDMMSALDGTRTASGFQHAFRAVLAKAKDLKARVEKGEVFEPVQPSIKRNGTASPATPKKRRAGRDEDEGTPTKRQATSSKSRSKRVASGDEDGPSNNLGPELSQDMEEYIKNETDWENKLI